MANFSQSVADACRQIVRHTAVLTDVLSQPDSSTYSLESAKSSIRQEVANFTHFLSQDFHTAQHEEYTKVILHSLGALEAELDEIEIRYAESMNKPEFLTLLRTTMGSHIREIGVAAKNLCTLEETEKRTQDLVARSRASLKQCYTSAKQREPENFSYELRCLVAFLGKLSTLDNQLDAPVRQLLRPTFQSAKDYFSSEEYGTEHHLYRDLSQIGQFLNDLSGDTENVDNGVAPVEDNGAEIMDEVNQQYQQQYQLQQNQQQYNASQPLPLPPSPTTAQQQHHQQYPNQQQPHQQQSIAALQQQQMTASPPERQAGNMVRTSSQPRGPPPKPPTKPRPSMPTPPLSSIIPASSFVPNPQFHSTSSAATMAGSTPASPNSNNNSPAIIFANNSTAGSTTGTTGGWARDPNDEGVKVNYEEELVQFILQSIKETCPRDWNHLSLEGQRDVEIGVKQKVKSYQNSLILTMIADTSPQSANTSARSHLVQPINKPRGKLGVVYIDMSVAKGMYKELHSMTLDFIAEAFSFVQKYNDTHVMWDPHRNTKLKEEEASMKQCPFRTSLMQSANRLYSQIYSASLISTTLESNFPECLMQVAARIKANLSKELVASPVPLDTKLFEKGQYIRFIKQSCLTYIYRKLENMLDTASHFCTLVARFSHVYDETATLNLLFHAELFSAEVKSVMDHVETYYTALAASFQVKKQNLKVKKFKDRGKESIWNEPPETTKYDSNDIFRPGNLNRLVERATTSTFNKTLMQTMLLAHQSLFSSTELWERLEDRYMVPKSYGGENDIRFIKLRVARMVLEWMKEEYHSIETSVYLAIHQFATKTLQDDDFVDLKTMLVKELALENYFSVPELVRSESPLRSEIPVYGLCHEPCNFFFNYTAMDFAEQMTLIEYKMYHQITRSQLVDLRWSKDKVQILASDVHALLTRVNEVSYFTATLILLQRKYRDRIKIFSHLLNVAKLCLELGNYNSFMGLLVGLRNGAVSRLPHSSNGLKSQAAQLFQQLSTISDPTLNFKAVREHMASCKNVLVPYVGNYLSDLTFTYEGNADWVTIELPAPNGTQELLNLTKFQMINRSIDDLLKYKNAKCDILRKDPVFTFLKDLPHLEEKEMYALSQLREPRGSNFKDIE